MAVRIRILGGLRVSVDEVDVGASLTRGRAGRVLATLALSAGAAVSKDTLCEQVWSDPPTSARNLIEKDVHEWRRLLPAHSIRTEGGGYRLVLDDGEVDVLLAREELAAAGQCARAHDWQEAESLLRRAQLRWNTANQSDMEAVLGPDTARELGELYVRVVETWGQAAAEGLEMSATDPIAPARIVVDDVVEALSRVRDSYPFREQVTGVLMRLLAIAGRSAEALELYAQTRRVLGEELGQEPGTALRHAHLAVLRGAPLGHDAETSATSTPGLSNMTARGGRVIGRGELLAQIARGFHRAPAAGPGAVLLWGTVGVGKSALAREFARRGLRRYDVTWFVDGSSTATLLEGMHSLTQQLGADVGPAGSDQLGPLWAALSRRDRWLLVLDGVTEHSDLAAVWPPVGGGDVLLTSLNPDWPSWLASVQVHPLDPETSALLLTASGEAGTDHTELARELGGLPLACEQAAAYMRQTGLSARDYLGLFRSRRADMLRRGLPQDHHQTIDAMWRVVREELRQAPAAALQLALFCAHLGPHIVPRTLLASVADDAPSIRSDDLRTAVADGLGLEDAIACLRRFSLVERDATGLGMHVILQAVIRDSVSLDEATDWHRRAVRAILTALEAGQRDTALLLHFVDLVGRGDHGEVEGGRWIDAGLGVAQLLVERGAMDDAVRLLQALDDDWASCGLAEDASQRAALLVLLAEALEERGEPRAALDRARRALALVAEVPAEQPAAGMGLVDAWRARATAISATAMTCHLGVSLWLPHERPAIREQYAQLIETLQRDHGDGHPAVARCLAGLAQVEQDDGDPASAVVRLEEARSLLEDRFGPRHPSVGHTWDKLGYALGQSGSPVQARMAHRTALGVLEAAYGPGHVQTAWPLTNLGVLERLQGELALAQSYQQRAYDIFVVSEPTGLPALLTEWRLGAVMGERGIDLVAAERHLQRAADGLFERLGAGHADVLGARADLARLQAAGPPHQVRLEATWSLSRRASAASVSDGFAVGDEANTELSQT